LTSTTTRYISDFSVDFDSWHAASGFGLLAVKCPAKIKQGGNHIEGH